MTTEEILDFLQKKIHTVILATIDDRGLPVTCAIDLMLLEDRRLYFLSARGKNFYQRLLMHPYISLTGLKGKDTMSSVAVSIQGKVKNIGHSRLKEIFAVNPYMKEIYPNEKSRDVLEVFMIEEFNGEYFDLSQKPIFRQRFSHLDKSNESGYYVTEQCTGCRQCEVVCPQRCIDF